MNNESRFHDQRIAEKKENGKWKSEKRNSKYETGKSLWKELNTEFTEKKKASNKEIQQEQKQAEEEKRGAGIDAAAREATEGADKRSRDGFKAGFLAEHVKRANGGIAGEGAAEDGNLVMNPNGKVPAIAPHQCGAHG
jgi:hypothetical protein